MEAACISGTSETLPIFTWYKDPRAEQNKHHVES
jgi:hypothetical protein